MTDLIKQALRALESVLCDPQGRCCIAGTNADRAVVDDALDALRQCLEQPDPIPAPPQFKHVEYGYYRDAGGQIKLGVIEESK